MKIYVQFSLFSVFFFMTTLSYTLILPVSQLKTQQLMTLQSRPHIDKYKLILFLHLFYT